MTNADRRTRLILAAALIGAVPVAFGIIRAVTTGVDVRYLWMTAAAFLAAFGLTTLGRASITAARASKVWVVAVIAGATISAAAVGIAQGATAASGIAIVSLAFGLCTGASAVLATRARSTRIS